MWTPAQREEIVEAAIRDYWERVEGSWRYPQKTVQERLDGYNSVRVKTHVSDEGKIIAEFLTNPNYDPSNPNGTPPDIDDEEYDNIYYSQQDDTSNECVDETYNAYYQGGEKKNASGYRPEGFDSWSNSAKSKWIKSNCVENPNYLYKIPKPADFDKWSEKAQKAWKKDNRKEE